MGYPDLVPEKVVEPNQKKYPWYHQQFRRVPTIDQCYTDDVVCDFEANQQFKRDRFVFTFISTVRSVCVYIYVYLLTPFVSVNRVPAIECIVVLTRHDE